jgi:hypothetical protein
VERWKVRHHRHPERLRAVSGGRVQDKAALDQAGGDFAPLIRGHAVFQTGIAPVPPEETIKLFAFMGRRKSSAGAASREVGDVLRLVP